MYRCIYIYIEREKSRHITRPISRSNTDNGGLEKKRKRLSTPSCELHAELDASWFEFLSLEPGRVKAGHTYSRAEPDCYANSVNVA